MDIVSDENDDADGEDGEALSKDKKSESDVGPLETSQQVAVLMRWRR